MPICHVIGARLHGCPIAHIQFDLFLVGHLSLYTHMICTSIMHASMASFTMFPKVFETNEKCYRQFRLKDVLQSHF